ncbi:30S ribosomal protein S7 [Candidatus Micrarchaeota archaeon]|jgi:small subunit ribosomal protein S7|nr:30S ribosomal protein S7 [Candidatus Micrarchaeota archaeon]
MGVIKLFEKYDYDNIEVSDISLKPYINLNPVVIPHSYGRHGKKQFGKADVNLVERLINKLMRAGTGEKLGGKVIRTHGGIQGRKSKASTSVEKAFEIVFKKTKENPIQLLVKAVENSAPREDFTRVALGGVTYQVAVDVSPLRRVDMALRNIALAAIMGAFDKKKTLAQALADELEQTAKGDPQTSYAIKKRNEVERMAKAAR